jgi:exonuclease SbcD
MRVLHTSDWHVGKRLGRHDRMDEHRAALDEVVGLAAEYEVDLVLNSGDLFDRPLPPIDALQCALDALVRLADGGRRPVVVVAGNHDSGDLFEALAPFVSRFGIHLVGRIKPPDGGGVLTLETGGGLAHVAAFPFLRAARSVDFMERADRWYGAYADRVRRICEVYSDAVLDAAASRPGAAILIGHFMVDGVTVGREAPRGERELHMGEAYAATGQAIPTALDYVALGHIHAPQPVPGVPVPAEYAGSLLQLDFGEAGEAKRVVIADLEPGVPARIESVPLGAGRPLVRVSGSWEEIAGRTDLGDVWLDLVVDTEGPDPGLMDQARERFERVVKVQARYQRPEYEGTRRTSTGRPWVELYAEYHREEHGAAAPEELLRLFTEAQEQVGGGSG